MNPCECKSDNFYCQPIEGCICRYGFTGADCTQSMFEAKVIQHEGQHFGSIVAYVLIILILFVCTIILLWFYYKRRVNNLKNEIAHVQYIADQQALSPGKMKYDAI